jgi:hypothetical protein
MKFVACDLEKVEARGTGGRLEERAGAPAKLKNLHVLVDHHSGGTVQLEHLAIRHRLEVWCRTDTRFLPRRLRHYGCPEADVG